MKAAENIHKPCQGPCLCNGNMDFLASEPQKNRDILFLTVVKTRNVVGTWNNDVPSSMVVET